MPNTYNVYIRKWKTANGTPDSGSEKLMFSIPQNNPNGFPMISPSVKSSEDSADSLDFTLNAGMEYYDLLIPMITLIRVEYYENTIFYGRVLTINASTILQTKSVHCEGAFAFFNDSFYPATADGKREEINWLTYLDRILSNHNAYISGNDFKKFNRGYVTIDGSTSWTPYDKKKKFEPTGWTQTSSSLSSLKDELGGHMIARYAKATGGNYLDWYKYAKRDLGDNNRPVVEVGENVIDISGNMDVGNLFTRVIPVGKNDNDGTKMSIAGYKFTNIRTSEEETIQTDYMPVSMVLKLYQDSDLTNDYHSPDDFTNSEARYGIIYKTVQFSDAATQKELFEECAKWIKESYYGAVTSLEIRAIDMRIINASKPIIFVGDCVDIYYKIVENGQMVTKYRKMVCKSVKYDLFNPSNNSYTFGIPSDLLKTSKSQSMSSNKKKTASQSISTPKTDYTSPDTNLTFQKIADIIRKDPAIAAGYGGDAAADSFIENGEIYGTRAVYDADIHYDPVGHPEICFNGQIAGKITLPNMSTKWVAFNNAHGLFAYIDDGRAGAVPTMHWYVKSDGYSYTNPSAIQYYAQVGATGGVLKVIGAAQNIAASVLEMNLDELPTTKWFNPRAALDQKKATAAIYNTTGTIAQIFSRIGKDGTGDDSTTSIIQDGTTGKTTFFDNLAGSLSTRKTIEQNGLTGETSFYGTDTSSGIAKKVLTALVSGFGGGSFDLSSLDTNKGISMVTDNAKNIIDAFVKKATGEKETTAEISGSDKNNDGSSDTSIGKIKVGKNLAAGAAAGFKVVMNESQAYKGYRVNSQGQGEYFDTWGDGFVFANDLKLDSIPSFRTEKAVIDKLWVDQATVNNLTVNHDGWIKNLDSDTIHANTRISTSKLKTWEIEVSGSSNPKIKCGGSIYAGGTFYLQGDGDNTVNLGNCFNGGSMNQTTGVLTLSRANGSTAQTFNMADMAWHKNAVSAAKSDGVIEGRNSIYGYGYSTSLNPGGSTTVTLGYQSPTGANVPIGKAYTISARGLNLQAKSTAPTTSAQTITADAGRDGLSSVNVSAAVLQEKNCTPTTSAQEITADAGYYGLSKVNVAASSGGASDTYPDLYPDGAGQISENVDGIGSSINCAKLTTALNHTSYGKYVHFWAYTMYSNGTKVSGTGKRFCIRQLKS